MKNFTYYRPTTPEQAVGLLDTDWGTTELLAGGTDLLDLQKEYVAQPDKVVSLSCITGLDKIEVFEREPPILTIGVGATWPRTILTPVARSPLRVKAAAACTSGQSWDCLCFTS